MKKKKTGQKKNLEILKNYECQNIKTSWKVGKSPRKVTKKKNKNKNRKQKGKLANAKLFYFLFVC